MALQRLDVSGITRSLGMLQQQRQYEEQVRLQKEAQEKAEYERRRAEKKQKDAEKRAKHVATVTAVGTVAGAVAGSFISPGVGTSLGAAAGGALGTALSGGEVSPGQIANLGVSAVSAGEAYNANQQRMQTNKAMLSQYSKLDNNFVQSTGMSHEDLLGMDTQTLGSLIAASARTYETYQSQQDRKNFNTMLMEAQTSNPDMSPESKNSFIKNMKMFQNSPVPMQKEIYEMLKSPEVNPNNLAWETITRTPAQTMPRGFDKLDTSTKKMMMHAAYTQSNPTKVNLLNSDEYVNASPEAKLQMIEPVTRELISHPLESVNQIASKQYLPEIDRLRKQVSGVTDYSKMRTQVDQVLSDPAMYKAWDSGVFDIRTTPSGDVQLVEPQNAGEPTFRDNIARLYARSGQDNVERSENMDIIKEYIAQGNAASDPYAFIAKRKGYDIKKNPDQAMEVIKFGSILDQEAQALGKDIGQMRANNTFVSKDVLLPSAQQAVAVRKDGTLNYQQSLGRLATLEYNDRPIDKDTRAFYAKQGIETAGMNTLGDLKRIQKQETNIGKVRPELLAGLDQLERNAQRIEILAPHASSIIGPIAGGSYLYSKGTSDRDATAVISPEEFQALGMPELKVGETPDGGVQIKFSQSKFNSLLSNIRNLTIKDRSGTAVSLPEFERLKEELPFLNDWVKSFDSKFTNFKRNISEYKQTLGSYGTASTEIQGNLGNNMAMPINGQGPVQAQPVFDLQGNQMQTIPDFSTMDASQAQSYFQGLTLEQKKQLREKLGK